MTKTATFTMRIEPELKKELENTAKKMRLSLAQFMIIAAIEKASKEK